MVKVLLLVFMRSDDDGDGNFDKKDEGGEDLEEGKAPMDPGAAAVPAAAVPPTELPGLVLPVSEGDVGNKREEVVIVEFVWLRIRFDRTF